jgi:predicted nucleic acid-binding protein
MPADAAPWPYRVVADTNVFVSAVHPERAERSRHDGYQVSPSEDFILRAVEQEFVLLLSLSCFLELAEKLEDLGVDASQARQLLEYLRAIAEEVVTLSTEPYCDDRDDDKFVWAALDGRATHLVTADRALTRAAGRHDFRVMQVVSFLRALRAELKAR